MDKRKIQMSWQVGYRESLQAAPGKMVPATVPGAVQLDWAKAEGWPDYTYSDEFKRYEWMEDVYWSYSAKLPAPSLRPDERLVFVCKGVDYRFLVTLADEIVHEQEGMFTPFELDVTEAVRAGREPLLGITVFPAPKRPGAPKDRSQADQSCKPAVSYGWDWHPRLIPLGIWDDAYLEVRSAVHIREFETFYQLSNDYTVADISVHSELSDAAAGIARWTIADREGRIVIDREQPVAGKRFEFSAELKEPELWWPNGQGKQSLYTSTLELHDDKGRMLDRRESRIGFRSVKLVMHPGAWKEPSEFPKSRSNPPITLEVNGRALFGKGSNWVNPEIFPGTITEETYRVLLKMAKDANMNLLRVWGGGIVNKDSFFRLCDELGLMVWQEFPLACNNYVGSPHYLRILDQESRSIIKRLRTHACLVMWCGGNELFNAWSGMTDQSAALRLLNRNCYDLDPDTPYLMTSPVMGMAHGHYTFRDEQGNEVFQTMPGATNTAYTEFGCPGPSSAAYLRTFIPEAELFPPRPGTAWETHHAFGVWRETDWLNLETLEHYFGPSASLEELVERGQLLQSEGYKCIYEEARRQKPVCSMALNWCYNEPWPTAANNSLIDWPAEPKPAYWAVRDSCRPALISARIPKFVWTEGEWFDPELWLLNDSPEPLRAGTVEAWLEFDGQEPLFLLTWTYPDIPANTNLPGPIIRYPLPGQALERMKLVLKAIDRPEMDSHYVLRYKRSEQAEAPKTSVLNMA